MSMNEEFPTPGLRRLKRHNGRTDCYWVATPAAVKAGFTPKTARLPADYPIEKLSARCLILHQEMLRYLSQREPVRQAHGPNTVGWICTRFRDDAESPLHELRKDTRTFYTRYMRLLMTKAGDADLYRVMGSDLRRWFREWKAENGHRSAYACIQTLRRVTGYGCELRNTACYDLRKMLEEMEFKAPKGRSRRPTYQQMVDVRAAAHRAGRPSVALAAVLQFELSFRQKDVIGEWDKPRGAPGDTFEGAIAQGGEIWAWGLTWSHIDSKLVLRKPTSKSNGTEEAEHDLQQFPDIIAELPPRGLGPIVIDEHTGLPWKREGFSREFRRIAAAAGWPPGLWNMDSRAGAISEGFEAGADPADVMKSATHTQLSTTMRYNRGSIVQSTRVAELRAAARKPKPGEAS